jgi:MoxR-like ATPase
MENHKELPNRIKELLAYLNGMLGGKEEAIRLTLLSAIAGENIFLSGPSGFDKMILVRCVSRAFKSHYDNEDNEEFPYRGCCSGCIGDYRYENDSFTSYEEDCDVYHINFIDNDIQAVSRNQLEKPFTFLAVASQKTQPFNLADKILEEYIALHVQVNTASNDEAFFKFVENPNDYVSPTQEMMETLLISDNDIANWWAKINKVRLSDDAKKLISEIRRESFEYFVSDFRWKKIVRVLKTCAFLNGRDKVDLIDCSLIDYAIPNHVVEDILKQKAINRELDRKQHTQYKENIFVQQKYFKILSNSVADLKLEKERIPDL